VGLTKGSSTFRAGIFENRNRLDEIPFGGDDSGLGGFKFRRRTRAAGAFALGQTTMAILS
jgi:hypothetical protein